MNNQEENWELMTVLGIPWTEIDKISKEDKEFLLGKAKEIKAQMMAERRMQQQMQSGAVTPPPTDNE